MIKSLPSAGFRRGKNPSCQGFTLLEILVTIALTGLIMLGASSLLENAYRISRRSYTESDINRILRLVTRRLEETLGSAYLYSYNDNRMPLLKGTPRGFSLPVCLGAEIGRAEFLLLGDTLVYRWEDLRTGENSEAILAVRLSMVDFSYLDENGVWLSVWQKASYPRLVRLKGAWIENEKINDFPDIIIPILVGTEYGGN